MLGTTRHPTRLRSALELLIGIAIMLVAWAAIYVAGIGVSLALGTVLAHLIAGCFEVLRMASLI